MIKIRRTMLKKMNLFFVFLFVVLPLATASAQDWIRTGTNRGAPVRLAAADFKASTTDAQSGPLNAVFNQTLWNDLDNSGVFEMVAKSFYPLQVPGTPGEMKLDAWANAPEIGRA